MKILYNVILLVFALFIGCADVEQNYEEYDSDELF
jgi:hypothetical protein